jgi:hypothetical protein
MLAVENVHTTHNVRQNNRMIFFHEKPYLERRGYLRLAVKKIGASR